MWAGRSGLGNLGAFLQPEDSELGEGARRLSERRDHNRRHDRIAQIGLSRHLRVCRLFCRLFCRLCKHQIELGIDLSNRGGGGEGMALTNGFNRL